MDVGDDGKLLLPTLHPQFGKRIAVQDADARCVRLWVKVVVKDRVSDLSPAVSLESKQEDSGLVLPPAAAFKLGRRSAAKCASGS